MLQRVLHLRGGIAAVRFQQRKKSPEKTANSLESLGISDPVPKQDSACTGLAMENAQSRMAWFMHHWMGIRIVSKSLSQGIYLSYPCAELLGNHSQCTQPQNMLCFSPSCLAMLHTGWPWENTLLLSLTTWLQRVVITEWLQMPSYAEHFYGSESKGRAPQWRKNLRWNSREREREGEYVCVLNQPGIFFFTKK